MLAELRVHPVVPAPGFLLERRQRPDLGSGRHVTRGAVATEAVLMQFGLICLEKPRTAQSNNQAGRPG